MKWVTVVFILMAMTGFVIITNRKFIKIWAGTTQINNEANFLDDIKIIIGEHRKIRVKIKAILDKKQKQGIRRINKNIQQLLFQYDSQIEKAEKALQAKDLELAKEALIQAEETLNRLIKKLNIFEKSPQEKEKGSDIKMAKKIPEKNHLGDFLTPAIAFFIFLY